MTRKCVLCKETNYKNISSFFSAPKNPEVRRKWQTAIAIENYSVTDDTYVCSKHFNKCDIITHWMSGVPPHVVTIKLKKCRLRPGAVPIKNINLQSKNNEAIGISHNDVNNLNDFNDRVMQSINTTEIFHIPREKEISNANKECSEFPKFEFISTNILVKAEQSSEDESNINIPGDNFRTQLRLSSNRNIKYEKATLRNYKHFEIKKTDIDMEKIRHKENIDYQLCQVNVKRSLSNSSNVSSYSEEDETSAERWEHSEVKINNSTLKKCLSNNLKRNRNPRIKQQMLNIVNDGLDKYHDCLYDEIRGHEILFEDLLEMCFEVTLPRGWSCNVTSKGHATTIVYLSMGMTKDGIPFLEKQVFVKTDMILRFNALNREIDPIMYNLIRENKDNKVQCLLDIEEVIDEFNLRTICEGITENFQENNYCEITCTDGMQWRHVLCPRILNNDSTRCSKCTMLSYLIKRRFREPAFCKSYFNLREQKNMCTRQRKFRCVNKHCTK